MARIRTRLGRNGYPVDELDEGTPLLPETFEINLPTVATEPKDPNYLSDLARDEIMGVVMQPFSEREINNIQIVHDFSHTYFDSPSDMW